jgi:hypothetical protein
LLIVVFGGDKFDAEAQSASGHQTASKTRKKIEKTGACYIGSGFLFLSW